MTFKDIFKIDKAMGESRTDQVIGIVLLIATILFMIFQ